MRHIWSDDDLLALSGIQHYVFCPRQWALIHLEQQWAENDRTLSGAFVHERCHDSSVRERRGDTLIVRGLHVCTRKLGLAGICDVVEFHECDDGVELVNETGLFRPVPVEYKRGRRKVGDEDRVQVCAQAIALEEMFGISVPIGYLYYDSEKHREEVSFDDDLRATAESAAFEMHKCYARGYTPKPRRASRCTRCSLTDVCVPELTQATTVSMYLEKTLAEVIE